MVYCTNTDVKTYGNVTSTDDDSLLTTLITRAQQIIDSHCNRTFEAAADSTKYFDAEDDVDGQYVYFDNREALELAQTPTTVTNGDATTIASTKYVLEPRNSAPYRALKLKDNADVAWTWDDTPENAISILGRWAYSVTAPADVVHACIRLTWWLYKQRDNANDLDRPQMTPNGGYIMPIRLPKDVEALLSRYRRLT